MRINKPEVLQAFATAEQVVANSELNLTDNFQRRINKQVQGSANCSPSRILNRDNAKGDALVGQRPEHLINAFVAAHHGGFTKMPQCRLVSESGLRAEIADLDAFFQGQTGGHNLTEQETRLILF